MVPVYFTDRAYRFPLMHEVPARGADEDPIRREWVGAYGRQAPA